MRSNLKKWNRFNLCILKWWSETIIEHNCNWLLRRLHPWSKWFNSKTKIVVKSLNSHRYWRMREPPSGYRTFPSNLRSKLRQLLATTMDRMTVILQKTTCFRKYRAAASLKIRCWILLNKFLVNLPRDWSKMGGQSMMSSDNLTR